MTRPSERSGAQEHRLLGDVRGAGDVDRARVGGGVGDDDGLAGLGDPAGDALPHPDAQRGRRLARVLGGVRPEGDRLERHAVLAEDVDAGVVERDARDGSARRAWR